MSGANLSQVEELIKFVGQADKFIVKEKDGGLVIEPAVAIKVPIAETSDVAPEKIEEMKNEEEVKIINFTPHSVQLLAEDASIQTDLKTKQLVAEPSAVKVLTTVESTGVARVSVTTIPSDKVGIWPVNKASYGEITGFVEPGENEVVIVSLMVISAMKAAGRRDFSRIRAVGRTVRDINNGSNILGCLELNEA